MTFYNTSVKMKKRHFRNYCLCNCLFCYNTRNIHEKLVLSSVADSLDER